MSPIPQHSLYYHEHKHGQTKHVVRIASAGECKLISFILGLDRHDAEREDDDHEQEGGEVERHVDLEPVESMSRPRDGCGNAGEGMMGSKSCDEDSARYDEKRQDRAEHGVNQREIVVR